MNQTVGNSARATPDRVGKRLEIRGIVQGVGFRPFVYQLAKRYRLKVQVANTSSGVLIHVNGVSEDIADFCRDIIDKSPPLAHITDISINGETVNGHKEFRIAKSRGRDVRSTLISPDVAVCEDCMKELFDPADRRYQYPFINCTNCGPRYTIIADIPYDRPKTSMKHFKLCRSCRAEYEDPCNRRFHAQANACADCGPEITLYNVHKIPIARTDPIERAAVLLKQGHILALKGLGGFHLAADAENDIAVARLRKRKHREEKPFAVMSLDLASVRRYARIKPRETDLLTSVQRPIVLLEKKSPHPLSSDVSPGNRYFGTMLPYTPLHYLLLNHGFTALVMTSGNFSDEPIVIDDDDAFLRLKDIADYFLVHNREIYIRTDDSIVKETTGTARFIRRSRGYVPAPIFLKKRAPQVLGCGAELKNTICLIKNKEAFLSQHIGDLKNLAAFDFFQSTIEHLKRIFNIDPQIVAFDLHPDYLSTRYAKQLTGVRKVPVQHHHAHIVACMAENGLEEPVIGLSFDGTGYGTDGKIWGGEILVAEPARFERSAYLSYVPMPGGAAAIKEPWRMAVSYLYHTFGVKLWNFDLPILKSVDRQKVGLIVEMISKGFNCPGTSSLGRLFDGIAAIIGIRNRVGFEGQAAMELEMLATEKSEQVYDYQWVSEDGYRILPEPIIYGVIQDMEKGICPALISSKFHETLIRMFSELCVVIRKERGLSRVALSGGVFQNSYLLTGLMEALEKIDFTVYTHSRVPANDGGIALGQALSAAAVLGQ